MARTKTMFVKNPSQSSTSNSETSYLPSPITHKDKGKGKVIKVSSGFDLETTMIVIPLQSKVVVIRSPKGESSMKVEKCRKKRKSSKYAATALFRDKKFLDKFDGSWVHKKVIKERYIYLLEIKECGWDILYFLKKRKWTRFFGVYEPIYQRLVKAFFFVVVVHNNNFTLKAYLKGIEILISK